MQYAQTEQMLQDIGLFNVSTAGTNIYVKYFFHLELMVRGVWSLMHI